MAGNPNDTLDMSDMVSAGDYGPYAPPGHFEKRYLERTPGAWHRATTSQVRIQLQRCFIDPNPLLEDLYAGRVVRTTFAQYKWIASNARESYTTGGDDA